MINNKTQKNLNTFFKGLENKKGIKYTDSFLQTLLSVYTTENIYVNNIEDIGQSLLGKSEIIIINFREQGNLKNKILYKSEFPNDYYFLEQVTFKIKKYNNKYRNKKFTLDKQSYIEINYIGSKKLLIVNFQDSVENNDNDLFITKSEFDRQQIREKDKRFEMQKLAEEKIEQQNMQMVQTISDGFGEELKMYNREMYYLDRYHTVMSHDSEGLYLANPYHNEYSQRILRLKNDDNEEIEYFSNKLYSAIIKEINYKDEIFKALEKPDYITCIPSHEENRISKGLSQIVSLLCAKFECKNACGALVRKKPINKLANGGCRDIEVHLDSISLNSNIMPQVKDKTYIVYLIDDVTTSGNSMLACKKKLEDNGYNVRCIALAKTVKDWM